MATSVVSRRVEPTIGLWAVVLVAEALSLVVYFGLTSATVTDLRYALYPFVWINAGIWGVMRVSMPDAGDGRRRLADLAGLGYFLALAALSGLVAVFGPEHTHTHLHGLQATLAAPGWGPRVGYVGSWFHVYLVPYRVVGYLALTYLFVAALRSLSPRSLSGLVGPVTCVGCTLPLFTATLSGVGGIVGVTTATLTGVSLDVSTAAFVLAVVALTYGVDEHGAGERGDGNGGRSGGGR
jgi:hypothetical protein